MIGVMSVSPFSLFLAKAGLRQSYLLPQHENLPKSELSSASLRNWNNGMLEYWNVGLRGVKTIKK